MIHGKTDETLADASPDERVTAAIHVLLSCLAKSGEDVVKLDKSLLDFHIDDLDQKISKQLDAVMHHPEFQKVESLCAAHGSSYSALIFAKKMSELNCWMSVKNICGRTLMILRKSFKVVYIAIHTFRSTIRRVANL